jgi:hypothetical protein
MGQRRSIGVAELVRQIADETFAKDGPRPGDQARLYHKCRRLARSASFGMAPKLAALALTARDERVKAVAALAVLEGAEEMSTDCI